MLILNSICLYYNQITYKNILIQASKVNNEKNELIIKNTPDYYIAREKVNGEIISKPIRKK